MTQLNKTDCSAGWGHVSGVASSNATKGQGHFWHPLYNLRLPAASPTWVVRWVCRKAAHSACLESLSEDPPCSLPTSRTYSKGRREGGGRTLRWTIQAQRVCCSFPDPDRQVVAGSGSFPSPEVSGSIQGWAHLPKPHLAQPACNPSPEFFLSVCLWLGKATFGLKRGIAGAWLSGIMQPAQEGTLSHRQPWL